MAGKKLVNYLAKSYQEGGLTEEEIRASGAIPGVDEYAEYGVQDWDTGLAKWLVDILGTEAGSMPRDSSGYTIGTPQDDFTTQMKGMVDLGKTWGGQLGYMGKNYPGKIASGLYNMLLGGQENAHSAINAAIERNNTQSLTKNLQRGSIMPQPDTEGINTLLDTLLQK